MGCFDTIKDRLYCPYCGKLQSENEFQTKDLGEGMNYWTIEEIRKIKTPHYKEDTKIYHICENCKVWIAITIRGEKLTKGDGK